MTPARLALLPLAVLLLIQPLDAGGRQAPAVTIPDPGVPQVMTIEGNWMRVAYNNEGYAIVGYRVANQSIGEDWMLVDVGITMRDKAPSYTLRREHLSLNTPDGGTLPLATNMEYRNANLSALTTRARAQRDNINYFPPGASDACAIRFFSNLDDRRSIAYDEVELEKRRGCLGQLFFRVPGGIAYGQYWLNVKFEHSTLRVPFRIMTKDEEKLLSKNFKDVRKQVQDAFKAK